MQSVSELPYEQRPSNKHLMHMRGEYGLPFVGKTLDMLKDPQALFRHYYEEYGPVSRISITGNKCVLLLHPDYVQRVLMDREKNFSTKMGWASVMADFFQGGLVMRDYDEHRLHRGIMQSSFKPPAMRAYATRIQAIVERTVERWAAQDSVLFYEEVKRLLLDIAFEVFCWVDDSESTIPKINREFNVSQPPGADPSGLYGGRDDHLDDLGVHRRPGPGRRRGPRRRRRHDPLGRGRRAPVRHGARVIAPHRV